MGAWIGAAALLPGVYAGSWFAGVRGLHDWLYPEAIWRARGPELYLTFDDGPDPERTPRLLELLDAAGARATFFVVGQAIERHPQLLERIAGAGHAIGNHSYSHAWLPGRSTAFIEAEIDRCQELVRDVVGKAPEIARPPYGHRDYRYYRALKERGVRPVMWSLNSRDYYRSSAAVIARRLGRARPGDVILCHDGDPLAPHAVEGVELWLRERPRLGLLSVAAGGGEAGSDAGS